MSRSPYLAAPQPTWLMVVLALALGAAWSSC